MHQNDLFSKIEDAYQLLKNYVVRTKLMRYHDRDTAEGRIFLKLENSQHTGSFKVRGALNKILNLSTEEKSRGIITASTGNHGLATGYALKLTKGKGTIYLPKKVSEIKLNKLKKFKVSLTQYGEDSGETEVEARRFADQNDLVFISPYNDPMVIAGQGTVAYEIFEELESVQNVFVTVGGGGLISGIAIYLKHRNPNIKIFGCQPENSAVMYHSLKKGKVIEIESKETLSDGSAGGVELNSITFSLIQTYVDEFVLISEIEIEESLKYLFRDNHLVVEGAAAVALAAYKKIRTKISGDTVIVICGGNIDNDQFDKIINS